MLYGNQYKICNKDDIVIYGAATTGAIAYKNLKELGLNVVAFLDQRVEEIDTYCEKPVWNMMELEQQIKIKEKIVFVAVKNVFEHEEIAKNIYHRGCKKIICRPYKEMVSEGDANDKCMNLAYEGLLKGNEIKETYAISGFAPYELKDKGVLVDLGETVIANIPLVYIHSDLYKGNKNIWLDIPCLGLFPHIGLFNLFSGKYNEDYKEYMTFCREAANRSGGIVTSDAWEKSVYSNRKDVYNHMEYAWQHDRKFFIKNAVEGTYNEKGYFNLNSGKHRAAFLIAKGSRYIPLKIKKEIYIKWTNKGKAEEINQFLINHQIYSLPVPIANPYFYEFSCSATNLYEKTLHKIITEIYRHEYYQYRKFDYKGKKIFFYNTPMVIYANIFAQIGFEVYFFENDIKKRQLYKKLIQDVSYVEIEGKEQMPTKEEFLITILNDGEENIIKDINTRIQMHIKSSEKISPSDKVLTCGYDGEGVKMVYIRER